ncbi:MAG: hypothetical protein RML45_08635 [Acetobacteraceae bacterium]|nr:hypothetical protein [Acetobacteraceae bacterium]
MAPRICSAPMKVLDHRGADGGVAVALGLDIDAVEPESILFDDPVDPAVARARRDHLRGAAGARAVTEGLQHVEHDAFEETAAVRGTQPNEEVSPSARCRLPGLSGELEPLLRRMNAVATGAAWCSPRGFPWRLGSVWHQKPDARDRSRNVGNSGKRSQHGVVDSAADFRAKECQTAIGVISTDAHVCGWSNQAPACFM